MCKEKNKKKKQQKPQDPADYSNYDIITANLRNLDYATLA